MRQVCQCVSAAMNRGFNLGRGAGGPAASPIFLIIGPDQIKFPASNLRRTLRAMKGNTKAESPEHFRAPTRRSYEQVTSEYQLEPHQLHLLALARQEVSARRKRQRLVPCPE